MIDYYLGPPIYTLLNDWHIKHPALVRSVTCTRCMGRGYLPEKRRPSRRNPHANGFYARTCPGCDGRGERQPRCHAAGK